MKKIILTLSIFCSGLVHAGAYAFYDFSAHEYIVENNRQEVRSIASITKLFTAITVLNSGVDLNEKVKINGRSRGYVPAGVYMTRMDLMRAMLISSDNRAAESLANNHPGGFVQFIRDANAYADNKALYNTKIVDSTGLLPGNQSTAMDLINFLSSIKHQHVIRSIAGERNAALNAPRGKKTITINLHNTNPEIFVYDNILISKTGFTNPAGRCVLMLIEKKNELFGVVVLGQSNVKNRSILVKELLSIEILPTPIPVINSTVEFEYSNAL
jgi:D-alanyl-D-alanine endopeptidase (penicillin-binding protein 7)